MIGSRGFVFEGIGMWEVVWGGSGRFGHATTSFLDLCAHSLIETALL
jgi:hypothetical protein